MSWLILGLFMFVPGIPSFFRLMKLAHDQSVINSARRTELKRRCDAFNSQNVAAVYDRR